MLRLPAEADGIFACAHEITQRFVVGRRNADRGELTGAMQPSEGVAIAPVSVLIRSPLRLGMLDGFTTTHSSP